ncbi:MAG: hypothetical protein WC662_00270 [Candidatus Paceibacterota bacterium]|jgi:hypothetical protein
MHEIYNPKEENKSLMTFIEKSANYEGDHTLLFLERLNNPEIKKKLVESLTREHMFWDSKLDVKRRKEREEKKLNNRIKEVFDSTKIDLNEKSYIGKGGPGDTGIICPFGISREDGNVYSKKQLNITEAHEKGHGVRSFDWESPIGVWIKSAFDFSKLPSMLPKEDLGHELYWQNPDEIIERMSQLKNYFGMKGNEEFTKEHLDYARKNYMKNTGFTLQIKPFFDSITKDTEKDFLDVINNLGV